MDSLKQQIETTRRHFLTTNASGIGALALSGMMGAEGLLHSRPAAAAGSAGSNNPLALKPSHFPARAKACISIFMAGAPSQLDLFDPKPKLNELHGQPLPPSLLEKVRFAFIKKDTATLLGSNRKFKRYGECGTEFSDFLPHIGTCADDISLIRSLHTDQFNHHPGQLMMQCGVPRFGMPAMGSWLVYGLGSASQNLPGYVVLTSGRGSSGGATLWSNGFLPSAYAGVPFRSKGDPVLNLGNPPGLPPQLQRRGLDALRSINSAHYAQVGDPEIASRIANYELAFRMQAAAPELMDLSRETPATLEAYGVNRQDLDLNSRGNAGPGTFASFSTNLLLARRLVERGVRFVNIVYASWDQHSNLDRELRYNATCVDQPIAALIRDLKDRGLLDQTLVTWMSEFGRTPLGENRGNRDANTGRDHHPFAFSAFLAGGGVRGGQVYGETDDVGWNITKDALPVNDLHATMLHLFGMDHKRLTYRFQGRDFRLTDVAGQVVDRLIA